MKNPDKVLDSRLKREYGITLEEYNSILLKQNNVCAICEGSETRKNKRLHVDHCHITGKVRGLLCMPCNRAIGMLKDDPKVLFRAYKYLDLDD